MFCLLQILWMETDQFRPKRFWQWSYYEKEMLTCWLKNAIKNVGTCYSGIFVHVSKSLYRPKWMGEVKVYVGNVLWWLLKGLKKVTNWKIIIYLSYTVQCNSQNCWRVLYHYCKLSINYILKDISPGICVPFSMFHSAIGVTVLGWWETVRWSISLWRKGLC